MFADWKVSAGMGAAAVANRMDMGFLSGSVDPTFGARATWRGRQRHAAGSIAGVNVMAPTGQAAQMRCA